jgi:hypothetical protein
MALAHATDCHRRPLRAYVTGSLISKTIDHSPERSWTSAPVAKGHSPCTSFRSGWSLCMKATPFIRPPMIQASLGISWRTRMIGSHSVCLSSSLSPPPLPCFACLAACFPLAPPASPPLPPLPPSDVWFKFVHAPNPLLPVLNDLQTGTNAGTSGRLLDAAQ